MRTFLILFFALFTSLFIFGQDIAKQNYGHLSMDDGLSQGYITAIVQDKTGFLWFGTNDGLNRYDGYDFRKYYNNISDTASISSNQISCLTVDHTGTLWVGTSNGLNSYDPLSDKFIRYNIDSKTYKGQFIKCLSIDTDGLVWFSYAEDPFLYCYNPKSKETKTYKIPQKENSPNNDKANIWKEEASIWTFLEDSDGTIWISSKSGSLFSFDKLKSVFTRFPSVNNDVVITTIIEVEKNNLVFGFADGSFCFFNTKNYVTGKIYVLNPEGITYTNTSIYKIIKDKNNNIFIGTQGEGLFFFDRKKKTIDQILFVEHGDRNIISKGIYSLFMDRSETLWAGTNGYGIYNLSSKSSAFKTINQGFRYIKENYKSNDVKIFASFGSREVLKSLNFQSIRGVYANDDFILTGGYVGLDKIDRKKGNIVNLSNEIVPYAFCPDPIFPDKYLWIGTESKGFPLLKYDIYSGKLLVQPLECEYVFALFPDKNNCLWVGSTTGLIKFNTVDKTTIYYKNVPGDPKSIQPGSIRAIKRDNDGFLWIGSETGGLSMMNETTGEFIRFQNQKENINSLSCNTILFLDFDKKNNILIGTGGGGINILDKQRKNFIHLTTKNGLTNNVIYSILEDNIGTYWVSTNNGICNINPKTFKIRCYFSSDGLQSNEFNTGSYFKDVHGNLFFGGVNGLTYFNPSDIKENKHKPDVVLTYIKKGNEEIKFDKPVSEVREIIFDHDDKVFSVGFSALSFFQSNKNSYAYKLSGLKDKWTLIGSEHELTFNSLEEGKYTLQIIAANNDGVWNNKPLVLSIIVKPPFYETWWFIILCLLLFFGLIIGFVFYRISQARQITNYLTREVEERTGEIIQQKVEIENQKSTLEKTNSELQKVNTEKDKFFSIIAHDLKSPFNAIIGFSRLLSEEFHNLSDDNKKTFAGNIKEASEASYRLLENLLEWSRVQANKIEIKPEVIDLGNIAAETFSLLHSSAEAKNINLSSSIVFNTTAYADENMVKTVFRNLVSNAIKFTKKGGEIKLSATDSNDYVEVSVSDNGVGISEENIKALFRLDVSLKSRGTANESGTGLGLIICKEFTERNGGTITVKSMIGIGSTFLFTLPKSEK